MLLEIFVCALIGYVLGCFNSAYYYARIKGNNIFALGSSTGGATNIGRYYGLKAGIFVGVLDGLKMILALFLVSRLFGASDILAGTTMLCCLAGHIFPAQLDFNGGKGAASLIGAALYLLPWQTIILFFAIFFVLFVVKRNYKKAGFTLMIIAPVLIFFFLKPVLCLFLIAGICLVVYSHFPKKIKFKVATSKTEFEQIARLNYQTFVEEIPQHHANKEHLLVDKMHEKNFYIVGKKGARVIAMVALNQKRPFSLDQKIPDLDSYIPADKKLCEVRLLSISPDFRKGKILAGLLGQIGKYVLKNKIDYLLISGTTRELKMYRAFGFQPFYRLVGKEGAWYQPMMLKIDFEEAKKWSN